jgi:hypothetical protein
LEELGDIRRDEALEIYHHYAELAENKADWDRFTKL